MAQVTPHTALTLLYRIIDWEIKKMKFSLLGWFISGMGNDHLIIINNGSGIVTIRLLITVSIKSLCRFCSRYLKTNPIGIK